ncbi:unnamed protein product [Schistocephalus solidus]|uniref:Uncharacterized protein n=1 Tax=Schistocephalus solidus TaxID=70667 RepID=A0A183TUQ5_SCHSO|nr:unnamed protein product [Schistocephalus solidus]
MALAQSEIFEDEFPLVRSCPALNEIRLAEEIKDLTIEAKVVNMFTPPDANSPLGQWTELTDMKQNRTNLTLLTSTDAVFALGSSCDPENSVETLTPSATSADSENDLTSWVWSSKDPVETLGWMFGAASILM